MKWYWKHALNYQYFDWHIIAGGAIPSSIRPIMNSPNTSNIVLLTSLNARRSRDLYVNVALSYFIHHKWIFCYSCNEHWMNAVIEHLHKNVLKILHLNLFVLVFKLKLFIHWLNRYLIFFLKLYNIIYNYPRSIFHSKIQELHFQNLL